MKRIFLAVLAVMAVVSIGAFAQAPSEVDKALLAAPVAMREGATVIKWKPDFTYYTLKKGMSRLVCYDRSGYPEQQPFSIERTSVGTLDRAAQSLKFEAVCDKAQTPALVSAAGK